MLPRINNSHKEKQPKARDENVRNEIDFLNRNDIQPMGNEAANIQLKENYTNMLREAKEDNMLDLSGYVEPEEVPIPYGADEDNMSDLSESENPEKVPIPDEVKKGSKKFSSGSIINNKPNRIEKSLDESDSSIDLNNSMYLNSSHNIVNENTLERLNKKQKNPDPKKIKDAKKQEKKINNEDDPEKIIDLIPDEITDDLVDVVEDANPELDRSMIAEAPKRKKKGGGKAADLKKVDDDMKPAEGFDFQPVKIPSRKKAETGDLIRSGLAFYTGKTLGRLLGLVCNIIYWSGIGIGAHWLYKKFTGKLKNKKKISPDKFQKTRRHDLIPGWDGRKFQEETGNERVEDDKIKVDFRKIPGVWSELIGAEAEDENGKPLKPVITVYVAEPEEMKDDLVTTHDIGHTYTMLMNNPDKKFPKLIRKLIDMVLTEDQGDSLIKVSQRAHA